MSLTPERSKRQYDYRLDEWGVKKKGASANTARPPPLPEGLVSPTDNQSPVSVKNSFPTHLGLLKRHRSTRSTLSSSSTDSSLSKPPMKRHEANRPESPIVQSFEPLLDGIVRSAEDGSGRFRARPSPDENVHHNIRGQDAAQKLLQEMDCVFPFPPATPDSKLLSCFTNQGRSNSDGMATWPTPVYVPVSCGASTSSKTWFHYQTHQALRATAPTRW